MRDWNSAEQLACGAQIGELACFWFEEKKGRFEFQGMNSKVRLVTEEAERRGHAVEEKLLRGRTFV